MGKTAVQSRTVQAKPSSVLFPNYRHQFRLGLSVIRKPKDTSKPMILVWFSFRNAETNPAGNVVGISEAPH